MEITPMLWACSNPAIYSLEPLGLSHKKESYEVNERSRYFILRGFGAPEGVRWYGFGPLPEAF
jgi:hypothetical protein